MYYLSGQSVSLVCSFMVLVLYQVQDALPSCSRTQQKRAMTNQEEQSLIHACTRKTRPGRVGEERQNEKETKGNRQAESDRQDEKNEIRGK